METTTKKEWLAPQIEVINPEIIKAEGTFADDPNFAESSGS